MNSYNICTVKLRSDYLQFINLFITPTVYYLVSNPQLADGDATRLETTDNDDNIQHHIQGLSPESQKDLLLALCAMQFPLWFTSTNSNSQKTKQTRVRLKNKVLTHVQLKTKVWTLYSQRPKYGNMDS